MTESTAGDRYPNLDQWVPGKWDKDAKRSLDQWGQGDLIGGVALPWCAPAEGDPVTGVAVACDGDTYAVPFPNGWSIVISQTCDVVASGPGERHPFVQVCPVVPFVGDNPADVLAGRIVHLYPVPCVPDAEGNLFVADLRVSIPVSKGLLSKKTPIPGFRHERELLQFAEHVAFKVRRAAVSDTIVNEVGPEIDRAIRESRASGEEQWFELVEQVRVLVDSRLLPSTARLVVVSEYELVAEQQKKWRELSDRLKRRLAKEHIEIDAVLFIDFTKPKIEQYRASVPVRVTELGRPRHW